MAEKKLLIYDTTLRDGAQGEGISFSVEYMLEKEAAVGKIEQETAPKAADSKANK